MSEKDRLEHLAWEFLRKEPRTSTKHTEQLQWAIIIGMIWGLLLCLGVLEVGRHYAQRPSAPAEIGRAQ